MAKIEAEELHAIVVADTLAVNIGSAVEKDLQKVVAEISRISSHANLPHTKYIFNGQNISAKGILHTIRTLPVKSDDVILFYFSGHGYRTKSKQSPWPNLFLTRENAGIDFDMIHREIAKRSPRLLIVFADVCNNIVPEIFAPPTTAKSFVYSDPKSSVNQAYKTLYRECAGQILIAGAKTGEFAWCTSSGALLTEAWIKSMVQEGEFGEQATWETLLNRASVAIKKDQNPFFELKLN